jgi:Domain of unknown function (DUF4136)
MIQEVNFAVEDTSVMNKRIVVLVTFLCVALTRTAAQGGNTEFAHGANFSQYKTYKWVHIKSAQELDELTAEQLVGTLEVALEKKGLTKSKSENADLYVGYQITDAKDTHWNPYPIGSSYDQAVGTESAKGAGSPTVVHTGELTLLLYDAGSKQLVWRSSIYNAIDAEAKPEKKQKHMDAAMEKLLKDYPPAKKS